MRRVFRVFFCWSWLLALAHWADGAGLPEFNEPRALLHVNGYTHHFNAPGSNDKLLGLGFTLYQGRIGKVVTAWEADLFRDSGNKFSAYVGRSWTLPIPLGKLGLTGALMYHRNFLKHNRLGLLPVGLPYFETPGRMMRLRFYYVPGMRKASDQQVAVQVLTPLWRARSAQLKTPR